MLKNPTDHDFMRYLTYQSDAANRKRVKISQATMLINASTGATQLVQWLKWVNAPYFLCTTLPIRLRSHSSYLEALLLLNQMRSGHDAVRMGSNRSYGFNKKTKDVDPWYRNHMDPVTAAFRGQPIPEPLSSY